jgi:hypothetical protein
VLETRGQHLVTPELQAAITDAYRAFGSYTIGSTLVVCHCNCCMTEEIERELVKTPLRDVPASLLAEYTNSAHAWDDTQVARELRYFLPRYFELIAADTPPDAMGLDICLRRLGEAQWRRKWPPAEVEIIDRFFDCLIVASLSRLDLARWPAGWRLAFDIAKVLTLVVTAGGDIDRILAQWSAAADPGAAIHMAALRHHAVAQADRTYLHSPYLEHHEDAADKIGAFLLRPEIDGRIQETFFAVGDSRLQKILSDAV